MVTLEEVARRCELSAMTVSRVINNKGYISDKTRKKVLEAIDELGYSPNLVARSLATNKTNTIGALIPYMGNQLYSRMVSGLSQEAMTHGYDIILSTAEDPAMLMKSIMALLGRQIDALVIFPMEARHGSVMTSSGFRMDMKVVGDFYRDMASIALEMKRRGIPGVIVGNAHVEHIENYVHEDYMGGAEMAVDYLVGKGHRKIGYLAHEITYEGVWGDRYQGFRNAMLRNGCEILPQNIALCLESVESGYDAMLRLMKGGADVTAVCCSNDTIAAGAINAAHTLGLRIPGDISIIGHDGSIYGEAVYPRLTTISIQPIEMGRCAFHQANGMMTGKQGEKLHMVEPLLVERDSVATLTP